MKQYAKAIVAALAAAAGTLSAALTDGTLSPSEITAVVLATLGALGITYAVPNKPPTPPTG